MGIVEQKKQTTDSTIDKNSYIIKEAMPDRAYKVLCESVNSGYKGLCVTRTDPTDIKNRYDLNIPFVWLTKQKNKDFLTSTNVNVLKIKIREFIKANKKSIILLDRLDYLINMQGFNNVLKFIYEVNDDVLNNKAILLLNINPLTLSQQELTLLEQELHDMPKPRSYMQLELQDDMHEILVFVNNSEKISFKHISKKFSITKTTTRKRINKLEERGLVTVKKNGRNKVVRITESGKSLL
jgi:DNA-binding MarR family transcriptional regulator